MKLVWHAEGLQEADWLRDMCGVLIEEEVVDLELTCFDDDTIHVISSPNWLPLPTYETYFRELRSRCKHIVLFHASDEWFSGGYHLYQYFDAVIRNFHTYLADHAGILTIPEGYSNGTQMLRASVKPANERQYTWMFAGEVKSSRIAMISAFDGFRPQLLVRTEADGTRLSKTEFAAAMEDTVFSPCPMGNAILETWRLYESLELGCIPLIEKRLTLNYFDRLFGSHPLLTFSSWHEARRFAEEMYSGKDLYSGQYLLSQQKRIGDWWLTHKAQVRHRVYNIITGASQTAALKQFAALPRNRVPMLYEPLRLAELLRHQNLDSLRRRLAKPVGPLKRILSDTLSRKVPSYKLNSPDNHR